MAGQDADDDGSSFNPPVPPAKRDYEVGYGKPPKHSQIKPGEVRNRRGKRKGTRSLKSEVSDLLNMPVPIKEGRRVTTRVAYLLKLRELALKGNLRAIERLHDLTVQYTDADEGQLGTAALLAEDELILARARERDRIAAEANPSLEALPAPLTEDPS